MGGVGGGSEMVMAGDDIGPILSDGVVTRQQQFDFGCVFYPDWLFCANLARHGNLLGVLRGVLRWCKSRLLCGKPSELYAISWHSIFAGLRGHNYN